MYLQPLLARVLLATASILLLLPWSRRRADRPLARRRRRGPPRPRRSP